MSAFEESKRETGRPRGETYFRLIAYLLLFFSPISFFAFCSLRLFLIFFVFPAFSLLPFSPSPPPPPFVFCLSSSLPSSLLTFFIFYCSLRLQ